jgi:hypothetical protein
MIAKARAYARGFFIGVPSIRGSMDPGGHTAKSASPAFPARFEIFGWF